MKALVQIDPDTLEESVVCVFELESDAVVVDPPEALRGRPHLRELGPEKLQPNDGRRYYDALDAVRGTFYYVTGD